MADVFDGDVDGARRRETALCGSLRWARHRLRQVRLYGRALRRLAKQELKSPTPPGGRRPRWWLRGFLSQSVAQYQMDTSTRHGYVTDYQRYRSTRRLVHPRLQDAIKNRLTTSLLLRNLDVRTVTLLGIYWRGGVHRFPTETRTPLASYLQELTPGRQIVFRSITGSAENGSFQIDRLGDVYALDGRTCELKQIAKRIRALKRPMVVEEAWRQHDDLRALYPDATNIVRVVTMPDPLTGLPYIPIALQFIGARDSTAKSDVTKNGMSTRIDLETGRLGRAAFVSENRTVDWCDVHPDTGATIVGRLVPHWDLVRSAALHAARALTFLEVVAWDLTVDSEGPLVLRANVDIGMSLVQIHQPLLSDPRVREYLVSRGVVPQPAFGRPAGRRSP